jgi:hypothetical protein
VVSRNSFKFVMLPPQTDTTRGWAKRLAEAVPEVRVVLAEDADTAAREIADAEAAFGWLGKELLSKATNLRWLQAPQAAPAAGYYYPELISHPVRVTNFREIFNDHTRWWHSACYSSSLAQLASWEASSWMVRCPVVSAAEWQIST